MVFSSFENFTDILKPDHDFNLPPHTKVICTIGPASSSVEVLEKLLTQGVTVLRFDLSSADAAWFQATTANVREAEKRSGRRCAVMLDTCGPELSITNTADADVSFAAGGSVTISTDPSLKLTSQHLPVAYALPLIQVGFQQGATLFVDEYLSAGDTNKALMLTVDTISTTEVTCTVQHSCTVSKGAHLRLHGANLRNEMPILSDSDRSLLLALKPQGYNFVCLSYCRTSDDVESARSFLQENGLEGMQLVAKIANKEGLVNHQSIIEAADAVIIARGHLGVDLAPEKVFVAQKMVVRAANMAGKTVLSARVVDTMVHAPRPTRAEATDVANLVLDGTDGIMLGNESFKGTDPALAARTVLSICKQAERCYDSMAFYNLLMDELGGFDQANLTKSEALASSAVRATTKTNAKLIIAFTITGRTPRLLAKYRATVPILAVVAERPGYKQTAEEVARQLLLLRSVIPMLAQPTKDGRMAVDGSMTDWALEQALAMGLVRKGEGVVVSQCPKVTEGRFEEAGVVKFLVAGSSEAALPHATSSEDVRTLIGLE